MLCCAASQAERDLDYSRACQFRWCWCDALFMAPPGYFQLSADTGNNKFAKFADEEYWVTTDYLFRDLPSVARGSGLFLRDSTFFTQRDDNGDAIYWSRGNGWVFAGLPAILDSLKKSDPMRSRCAPATARSAHSRSWTPAHGPHACAVTRGAGTRAGMRICL